jgi:hypothetical protein
MRRAKSSRIVDCGRRTEEYGRHRSTCETSVRRMIIQVRNTDKYQVLGTAVSGIGLHESREESNWSDRRTLFYCDQLPRVTMWSDGRTCGLYRDWPPRVPDCWMR